MTSLDPHQVRHALRGLMASFVAQGQASHVAAFFGRWHHSAPLFGETYLPQGKDIFDLASITKALVTTPLVFRSLAKRGLTVDATLDLWLGPAADPLDPRLRRLTVRSLLRHESGLPAWRNFWICHLGPLNSQVSSDHQTALVQERLLSGLNRAASMLDAGPSGPIYSDVGFLLLGWALAEVEKSPLATQFASWLWEDLALDPRSLDLFPGFCPHRQRAVPTAYCPLRGRLLEGEVHDENAASLGGIQGHAGLFGTGEAIATYLHALAGSPMGRIILDANGAAILDPDHKPTNESLLGWRQGADASARPFADGWTMGHLGFTGVAFWICYKTGEYAILLTNRVMGGRTRAGIATLRREAFGLLNQLRT